MIVTIKGGKKYQKEWVDSITRYCTKRLMSTRLFNLMDVTVKLKKDLFHREGLYGDAEPEDWDDYRPKLFIVRVDSSLRLRPMLQTLCHELVHVSQYAKGDMREVQKKGVMCTRFKGEYYPQDSTRYWFQPWEVQANGLERGLFEMWAEDTGVFKDKKNNWAYLDEFPRGYWEKKWKEDKQKKLALKKELIDNRCMLNETTTGAQDNSLSQKSTPVL